MVEVWKSMKQGDSYFGNFGLSKSLSNHLEIYIHQGFHQVWYQGIVKATVFYRLKNCVPVLKVYFKPSRKNQDFGFLPLPSKLVQLTNPYLISFLIVKNFQNKSHPNGYISLSGLISFLIVQNFENKSHPSVQGVRFQGKNCFTKMASKLLLN